MAALRGARRGTRVRSRDRPPRREIRRFDRFPHRNAVLGRENTPEEAEYLKAPPSWGLTAEEFAEWEREKEARERAAG